MHPHIVFSRLSFCLGILLIFIFPYSLKSQSVTSNKDNARLLGSLNSWCSDHAEYTSRDLIAEQPKNSCSENPLRYGQWFKFQASSANIEIIVKVADGEGTMKFPYLFLRDEALNELACKEYHDETEDLVLNYGKLTAGQWYYISVNHPNNSKYVGTFTLCLNDEVSYDFRDGAIELTDQVDWCSDPAIYTTEAATPDQQKGSCLKSGPNFNRWFKFRAMNQSVKITVKYGGEFGDCEFPYLTLWDHMGRELDCGKYKDNETPISVSFYNLDPGNLYYLSVDHQYNDNYPGSFTLCVDDGIDTKAGNVIIMGKLMRSQHSSIIGSKVLLLVNEKGDPLGKVITDSRGKFKFKNLLPNAKYLVKINEDLPGYIIEIYQTDYKGKIIKKTVRYKAGLYGFEELSPTYNKLAMMDFNDIDIEIKKGKTGIVGKIVDGKEPIEGSKNLSVMLFNSANEALVAETSTDQLGEFEFLNIPSNVSYLIKLGDPGNEIYSEMLMINDLGIAFMSSSTGKADANGFFRFERLPAIQTELALMDEKDFGKLELGSVITLNNIYFEQGKYDLLEKSHKELDRLAENLFLNPAVNIEVSGHTDNTGNDEANLLLSEKRAEAVVNYLVTKQIERKRLSFIGYGQNKPVASNKTEEGKQKNRRVEFKILE